MRVCLSPGGAEGRGDQGDMGNPTYVLYILCVGVCLCVCGDKGEKGIWGTVLKSSMYRLWLRACVRGGGGEGNHGIWGTLHMFPLLCVDLVGRETRRIRGMWRS